MSRAEWISQGCLVAPNRPELGTIDGMHRLSAPARKRDKEKKSGNREREREREKESGKEKREREKGLVEGRKVYEIEPCTHEYLDLQILYSTEVQSHKQLYTVHMSYSPLYSDNTLKRLFP
ncbi:hypothetical protein ANTPLA_LOCUS8287 [Anthophora plagiata]